MRKPRHRSVSAPWDLHPGLQEARPLQNHPRDPGRQSTAGCHRQGLKPAPNLLLGAAASGRPLPISQPQFAPLQNGVAQVTTAPHRPSQDTALQSLPHWCGPDEGTTVRSAKQRVPDLDPIVDAKGWAGGSSDPPLAFLGARPGCQPFPALEEQLSR